MIAAFRSKIPVFNAYLFVIMGFFLPLGDIGLAFVSTTAVYLFFLDPGLKNNIACMLRDTTVRFLLAFALFYLLWLFGTDNFAQAYWNVRKAKYYLLPLIFFPYVGAKEVRYFILAFFFGMAVSEFTSYGIYFELLPATQFGSKWDPSPFMDHVAYSVYLNFAIFLIIAKLLSTRHVWLKVILGFYFLVALTNIFITGGRSGQALLVINTLVLAFAFAKRKILALCLALALVAVTLFSAYHLSPLFKQRVGDAVRDFTVLVQEKNFSTSLGNRIGEYYITYKLIPDVFMFGVGTGDEIDTHRAYVSKNNMNKQLFWPLHSEFTHDFMQFGFLSLILLLFFYRHIWYVNQDKSVFFFKVVFFTSMFVFSFFNRFLYEQMAYLPVLFLLVLMKARDGLFFHIDFTRASAVKFSKYALLTLAFFVASQVVYYLNYGGFRQIWKYLTS